MRIRRTGHDVLLMPKIGNLAGEKGPNIVAKGVTREIEINRCSKWIYSSFSILEFSSRGPPLSFLQKKSASYVFDRVLNTPLNCPLNSETTLLYF